MNVKISMMLCSTWLGKSWAASDSSSRAWWCVCGLLETRMHWTIPPVLNSDASLTISPKQCIKKCSFDSLKKCKLKWTNPTTISDSKTASRRESVVWNTPTELVRLRWGSVWADQRAEQWADWRWLSPSSFAASPKRQESCSIQDSDWVAEKPDDAGFSFRWP